MNRLLVFAVLAILVWLIWRRVRALIASSAGQELRAMWRLLRQVGTAMSGAPPGSTGASRDRAGSAAPGARPILLVRCSVCGTHVPDGTARRRGQDTFCSEACERRAVP